jgi:hypothetical protein
MCSEPAPNVKLIYRPARFKGVGRGQLFHQRGTFHPRELAMPRRASRPVLGSGIE